MHSRPEIREFDYVVVGGGTAGSVLARRLSDSPDVSVALVEWGPSDENEPRAGELRRWPEMFESEYDLDYRSVEQARGNSTIRQTRMRLLGGCSTVNTMIAWRPPASDFDEWVTAGAAGWGPETIRPYFDRLLTPIVPVAPKDRNPLLADIVESATTALGIPLRTTWNDRDYVDGAGFFEVGYTPENNLRSSASRSYLHGVMHDRDNLHLFLETQARELILDGSTVTGIRALGSDGISFELTARHEVILSCGAIDTPRLLLMSGIGPETVLADAGVPLVHELPGVGANLMDHADALVVWEVDREVPGQMASGWDAGVLVRLDPAETRPDIVMLTGVETWADHLTIEGYRLPANTTSLSPNVAKPLSRGRVWITSNDWSQPPAIDYGSFTDVDGVDEKVILEGIRLARLIAEDEPMRSWIVREIFPGPDATDQQQLSELIRRTHQTVYHVAGTCRMGAPDDPLAVVDPSLRVRGLTGLRVADASVFPTLTSVNPMCTVLMVAERCVDLILDRSAGTP
jgi:choline dehydrogenase-like flavoprotein